MDNAIPALESLASQMSWLINYLALPCQLAHFTVVIKGVKHSWGENVLYQPFATWLFSMACCFGGSTLVNLLCGKPALSSMADTQSVLFCSLIWWMVFYCPKNFYSKIIENPLILAGIMFLKEMLRTRKILKGMSLGRSAYPSSLFLCTIMGMLMACGGGFVKAIGLTLSSTWTKDSIKNVYFSAVTKLCVCFSLLYNLQFVGNLSLSQDAVALIQIGFMYLITLTSTFGKPVDPFRPIDKFISNLIENDPSKAVKSAKGREKME